MIENIKSKRKVPAPEPRIGAHVKSKYKTTTLSTGSHHKRANSTTDATIVRQRSLGASNLGKLLSGDQNSNSGAEKGNTGSRRSFPGRPSPLAMNTKVEKPSFDVAAANRIKEADEQDENMTPMPKRHANRQEAKEAYGAKRAEHAKLAKLQHSRSESSPERSPTLKEDDSREELRADDDPSILHTSALGVHRAIIEADKEESVSE